MVVLILEFDDVIIEWCPVHFTYFFIELLVSMYIAARFVVTACKGVWQKKLRQNLQASNHLLMMVYTLFKAGPPPLDLGFWSFLTFFNFLHRGTEEVEGHLL